MRDVIITMVDEERYNNRQIERMFDEQNRRFERQLGDQNVRFERQLDEQSKDIKEHIDIVVQPIIKQGVGFHERLEKIEIDTTNYKVWRGWMTGGMAVIMIFLPILMGFLTWVAIRIIN